VVLLQPQPPDLALGFGSPVGGFIVGEFRNAVGGGVMEFGLLGSGLVATGNDGIASYICKEMKPQT